MHKVCEPSILYFGTPVALISTVNEDGTNNLAPMSSAFWLGWHCMLGLAAISKTTQNLIRTGECVINLPSIQEVEAVDRLALTTGSHFVPEKKMLRGYRFEPDKFGTAKLTPVASAAVGPQRALECPVQLEAIVESFRGIAEKDRGERGKFICFDMQIRLVHVEESIMVNGEPNQIDPDKWRPLIMSFQKFYGLGGQLSASRLSQIPESMYRSPEEASGAS